MKWRKLGLLYECPNLHPNLATHVANPTPVFKSEDTFRIYFNARDEQNRSSVAAVDIDIVTKQIVSEFSKPVFEYGQPDSFYENGISIGSLYTVNASTCLSFMGWQQPDNAHWFGEVGRFLVNSDLSLTLDSEKPMLGLDHIDPISISYPWIEKINDQFHMWYGSTTTWDAGNDEMLHILKHAVSTDGLNWNKKGDSIPYELGYAQAFSRPTLLNDDNENLTMWFSYRSGSGDLYRIGQSQKKGKAPWTKVINAPGLTLSAEGWDSEMLEYPYVFRHKDETYMLYNGNDYGKTGFGLAVLESNNA